jgi:prepilin-type N-terminal cleavage/methylation domain-containing protein
LHWEAAAAQTPLVNVMVKSCQPGDKFRQGESDAMKTACYDRQRAPQRVGERRTRQRGFSLIELLIGMSIMAVALLSIAAMFSTGYSDIAAGGKTTMAAQAARQIIEDMQTLPFDRLAVFNNPNEFNSNVAATLPANNPERDLARKWRYTLAGAGGTGWPPYIAADTAKWSVLGVSNIPFGGSVVVRVDNDAVTLRRVTVTVSLPGRPAAQLSTVISRL